MALGTLDIIGLADTACGLIEDLVDHGSTEDFWGSFTDSNEAIISKLDEISAKLDDAVVQLRSAIGHEVEDVQQQNLLSALARAENARDLLASAGSSDAVCSGKCTTALFPMQNHVMIGIVNNVFVQPGSHNQHYGITARTVLKAMSNRLTSLPTGGVSGPKHGFLVFNQD